MQQSAFALLGIGDKELPVSNLLANYLDPQTNYGYGITFVNKLCRHASLPELSVI